MTSLIHRQTPTNTIASILAAIKGLIVLFIKLESLQSKLLKLIQIYFLSLPNAKTFQNRFLKEKFLKVFSCTQKLCNRSENFLKEHEHLDTCGWRKVMEKLRHVS